ncbi:MAG: phosphate ABC transporter permease PstA [Anaerolineaceae bacterium]|nr:phosphate ABC transporter permease PstA [Anaerolineaceae bacterium]
MAVVNVVDPASLVSADGRSIEQQRAQELAGLARDHRDGEGRHFVSTDRLFTLFLEEVAQTGLPPSALRNLTVGQALISGQNFPQAWADRSLFDLRLPDVARAERDAKAREDIALLLAGNVEQGRLLELVYTDIVQVELLESWNLIDSLTRQDEIRARAARDFPQATLEFRSWLNADFLRTPGSSQALTSGIRVALLGTLWMLAIAIGVSLPLGLGAAIYLEEYARHANDRRLLRLLNGFIETNIRNLAGVPSIIYGILGLTVFVRAMEPLTSGQLAGIAGADGRTILSAGLTMALLILPIIIINAQEAIRAVPWSLREGSYGLGATQLQTIGRQVLPVALPGMLTGVILSVSRAIGETAPLVVVGAATTIFVDPDSPFSRFTVLPIQIYRWTADPREGFQDVAAATIIVLLLLLLSLNASAIILRNRYSARARRTL